MQLLQQQPRAITQAQQAMASGGFSRHTAQQHSAAAAAASNNAFGGLWGLSGTSPFATAQWPFVAPPPSPAASTPDVAQAGTQPPFNALAPLAGLAAHAAGWPPPALQLLPGMAGSALPGAAAAFGAGTFGAAVTGGRPAAASDGVAAVAAVGGATATANGRAAAVAAAEAAAPAADGPAPPRPNDAGGAAGPQLLPQPAEAAAEAVSLFPAASLRLPSADLQSNLLQSDSAGGLSDIEASSAPRAPEAPQSLPMREISLAVPSMELQSKFRSAVAAGAGGGDVANGAGGGGQADSSPNGGDDGSPRAGGSFKALAAAFAEGGDCSHSGGPPAGKHSPPAEAVEAVEAMDVHMIGGSSLQHSRRPQQQEAGSFEALPLQPLNSSSPETDDFPRRRPLPAPLPPAAASCSPQAAGGQTAAGGAATGDAGGGDACGGCGSVDTPQTGGNSGIFAGLVDLEDNWAL